MLDFVQLCKPSAASTIPPNLAVKYTLVYSSFYPSYSKCCLFILCSQSPGSVISCARARNELIVLGISKPNRILMLHVSSRYNNRFIFYLYFTIIVYYLYIIIIIFSFIYILFMLLLYFLMSFSVNQVSVKYLYCFKSSKMRSARV